MTAAAGSFAMFDERIDPGRVASFVLAAAVHLALFAVLMFGVRWQNRPPEAVQVELWNEPVPAPVQAEPKPAPEVAKPAPEPVAAKPEPVLPKPEPVIAKPDIALKEPAKIKPVAKPKPVPKPVPKPAPLKPKVDETRKRINEELAREQAAIAVDRERQQLKEQLARDASKSRQLDYDAYAGRIKAKIRGNIVLPPDLKGNPEAIFDVVQLPTGEVLSVKLRKSSGHAGYDQAVERAVLKASPLPRPDRPELFQRALELRFRPLD
jgi:colicin import membrane protein